MNLHELTQLGQETEYPDHYDANLLQPIPRELTRASLGIDSELLPFHGVDVWTHYEVSWLEPSGKPVAAIGEISVPAYSANLIESKSLKLYFNSLNFYVFDSAEAFTRQVEQDLSSVAEAAVTLKLEPAHEAQQLEAFPGRCLDLLPLTTTSYLPDPGLLRINEHELVDEVWHSHLLRTNCPVTDQPDWGSVLIHYQGPRIEPESLLAYLVSFRRHADFHEQCVERIFMDLQHVAQAQALSVYARYTRRGGLDINPFRSNFEQLTTRWRTARQ